MSRPDYITDDDIARWSSNIDDDPNIPKPILQFPLLREVCYAGLWLAESLDELDCPEDLIVRIQFTAGRLSFGKDPWQVAVKMLELYKTNELVYEQDEIDLQFLN